MKKPFLLTFTALALFVFIACQDESVHVSNSLVNPNHLDSLYQEIEIDNKVMGIIHIYSEYPEYKWVGDDDEGISCVDDVARAAVFYLQSSERNGEHEYLQKAEKLIEFILFMQNENGYFNNFIYEDYTKNITHKTSVAEPNWWTWRALWALSTSYKYFENRDPEFALRVKNSIERSLKVVMADLPLHNDTISVDGITKPAWLPAQTASDQASVLVMALLNYYSFSKDLPVLEYVNKLCEGIILMQIKENESPANGAFLSWENSWHSYGNLQSYALLKTYEITRNEKYLQAALLEIDNFYKYLLHEEFLSEFKIFLSNEKINVVEKHIYPQIAYQIRPIVWACLKAFEITGDSEYARLTVYASKWFTGANIAKAKMYDPATGICFDGINENNVNLNSGAESTIECLLALSAIEFNELTKELLTEELKAKHN